MIPTWSLWCQAWWKHPQPLIPHNLTQPSAFDHPSPFARNFLPTLSLWIMSASSKGRSSISYSMTTTTSAKIGFTTSLFVALDSTSVVVLYTWNVSMYFKKKTHLFPSIKIWVLWRSKECEGKEMELWVEGNVEESQHSSSITQCLLLRWCGWAGFAHALGNEDLGLLSPSSLGDSKEEKFKNMSWQEDHLISPHASREMVEQLWWSPGEGIL